MLALAAIVLSPVANTLCAWSCAESHHSETSAPHHACEDSGAGNTQRFESGASCLDHDTSAVTLAVSLVPAQAGPWADAGDLVAQLLMISQPDASIAHGVDGVPLRTKARSVLRI